MTSWARRFAARGGSQAFGGGTDRSGGAWEVWGRVYAPVREDGAHGFDIDAAGLRGYTETHLDHHVVPPA